MCSQESKTGEKRGIYIHRIDLCKTMGVDLDVVDDVIAAAELRSYLSPCCGGGHGDRCTHLLLGHAQPRV